MKPITSIRAFFGAAGQRVSQWAGRRGVQQDNVLLALQQTGAALVRIADRLDNAAVMAGTGTVAEKSARLAVLECQSRLLVLITSLLDKPETCNRKGSSYFVTPKGLWLRQWWQFFDSTQTGVLRMFETGKCGLETDVPFICQQSGVAFTETAWLVSNAQLQLFGFPSGLLSPLLPKQASADKNDALRAKIDKLITPPTPPALAKLRVILAAAKDKNAAHAAFDPIWQTGRMGRTDAYTWLAGELGIPRQDCHISLFDKATCTRVIAICKQYIATASPIASTASKPMPATVTQPAATDDDLDKWLPEACNTPAQAVATVADTNASPWGDGDDDGLMPPASAPADALADTHRSTAPDTEKPAAPVIPPNTGTPDKGNTEERLGEVEIAHQFMRWLSEGTNTCSLMINTDDAPLHTVEEGLLLVSPQVFQEYAPDNWGYVQESFCKCGFHKQTPDSGNFWLYKVREKEKSGVVRGILMPMPLMSFMGLGLGSGAIYLPAPNPALSLIDDTGQRFLHWLTEGLRTNRLPMNTPSSLAHTVKEGLLLVSPRVFREFGGDNWEYAQKRFAKLGLHKRTPDNSNIWLYHVRGEKKSGVMRGFLLENPMDKLGLAYLPVPSKSVSLPDSQPNITPKPTAAKIDDTLWIRLAEINGQVVDATPADTDKQGLFTKNGWGFVARLSHSLSTEKVKMNEPDGFAFLLPDGKLLLKYPDVFGSKKNSTYTIAAFKRCGLHIRNTQTPKMLWPCTITLDGASITSPCIVVEDAAKKLLLQLPPNINNNITAEIVGLHQQPNMPTPLVDTPPPQESPDQDNTSTVGNLQDTGIPLPVVEPDEDTNNTPSDEGITVPTVIPAEPDAPSANATSPASLDDWTDGFTPWLRQQMLDGKCPRDVVSVGQGKLLVGSQAFAAYCRESVGKASLWACVSRKFRLGLGITDTVKYRLPPSKVAGGKQPFYIRGILVTSPGKALNLPQSAIPQQSGYTAEAEYQLRLKKEMAEIRADQTAARKTKATQKQEPSTKPKPASQKPKKGVKKHGK